MVTVVVSVKSAQLRSQRCRAEVRGKQAYQAGAVGTYEAQTLNPLCLYLCILKTVKGLCSEFGRLGVLGSRM